MSAFLPDPVQKPLFVKLSAGTELKSLAPMVGRVESRIPMFHVQGTTILEHGDLSSLVAEYADLSYFQVNSRRRRSLKLTQHNCQPI
jgi:hypothetical protein